MLSPLRGQFWTLLTAQQLPLYIKNIKGKLATAQSINRSHPKIAQKVIYGRIAACLLEVFEMPVDVHESQFGCHKGRQSQHIWKVLDPPLWQGPCHSNPFCLPLKIVTWSHFQMFTFSVFQSNLVMVVVSPSSSLFSVYFVQTSLFQHIMTVFC